MPLLLLCLLQVAPAFAQTRATPITLANPGFEDELRGWDNADKPEYAGVFTLDHSVKHQGKAALHIESQQAGQWAWVSQKVAELQPGAVYLVKAWQRGGDEAAGGNCGGLRIEFFDAAGASLGARYVRRATQPLKWQQMFLQAEAPAQTASAVIAIRLMGDQEIWFDDVELVRLREAPPLLISPARQALKPAEKHTVKLEVRSAADLAEGEAQVRLLGTNDKPVSGVTGKLERADARLLAGEFALPALSPGRYTWEVKLGAAVAKAPLFVALAKRQPKSLDSGGVLLVEGSPFFPIGLYHVPVGEYATLAQTGFTAAQGLGSNEAPMLRTATAEAEKQKLLLDLPLYAGGLVGANLAASQDKVPYFAKSKAVLSWKLADQPDLHPEIADEVPEAYSRLKLKEEIHPFLISVESPASYEYWGNFCDILQVVCLPVGERPLSFVSERVRQARQVLLPWQQVSALLPCGWTADAKTQPTVEQARVMVYAAIIAGARSIWWYSFRDPGWELTESALWKQFRQLNEETAKLGEVATQGKPVALESDNAKIEVAGWTRGGKVYLALANGQSDTQKVTVKLPVQPEKLDVSKGEAKPELTGGVLTVELAGDTALLLTGAVGSG